MLLHGKSLLGYLNKNCTATFINLVTQGFWCQELWVCHRWIWELPTFFMVQKYTYDESESCLFYTSLKAFSVCLFFNIFTYSAARGLSCCLWDLVPPSGMDLPHPNSRTAPHLHLGGQSPSHWTTRKVPKAFSFKLTFTSFFLFFFFEVLGQLGFSWSFVVS